MSENYRIVTKRSDVSFLVNGLHKEETLSVGIMDTGTPENLEETLKWYVANYNHNLFIITSEEQLSSAFMERFCQTVSFIVFSNSPTLAQRINTMAKECGTTFFFITRSDVELTDFRWKPVSQLLQGDKQPAILVPVVYNKGKELIPTCRAPHMKDKEVDPLSFLPSSGTDSTLYPFLGMGIYNKAVFLSIRGYDEEISNAYWQALDFGTKCWLRGYPVLSVNHIAVRFFSKQFLIEDRSEVPGTERFYTRALSVRQVNGKMQVKRFRKIDRKLLKSEIKPEIIKYRTDFFSLLDNWEIPR